MWLHVLQRPMLHRNATGTKDEFLYRHFPSVHPSECLPSYLDKLSLPSHPMPYQS